MKILLIDSNEPINNRNLKIVDSLIGYINVDITVASWQRGDVDSLSNQDSRIKKFVFNKVSKLGNRYKKLFNLYSYFAFLKMINDEENPNFIIASHYDMLLLSYFFKKKNQFLIYENLDIPTSQNKVILKFLQIAERLSLTKTDYIIHASRFYQPLYDSFKGKQQIIENLPSLKYNSQNYGRFSNEKVIISFIGGVRYIDILIILIEESLNFNNLEIRIHGEGHESDKLNSYLKAKGIDNIVKVTGKYSYTDVPNLYLESDFIWAVYPNNNYNVKYAISNKYHECLFFQIPGIYASNTELGNLIQSENIGLTVDPYTRSEVYNLLKKISNKEIDYKLVKSNLQSLKEKEGTTWNGEIGEFYEWMKRKVK